MQRLDQSQSVNVEGWTSSGLRSVVCRWGNGCLFFDQSGHHHGYLPWRGELASPMLAYLTLPIPHPLICFGGLRNALYSVYMRPAVSTSSVSHESEIEHRWWAMLPGSVLPLSGGGLVRVVFPGYPGGSMGPDVHDAVLCLPSFLYHPVADEELQLDSPEKYVGDVEFHIR